MAFSPRAGTGAGQGEGSSRGPEPSGGLAQQPIQVGERHAGKRQKVVNLHMLHTTCTAEEAR